VMMLLISMYIESPADFSVFPSMILITTLYRLALNIASTRLILSNAGTLREAPCVRPRRARSSGPSAPS
jgi:flagellar biosynthesis component FlhA